MTATTGNAETLHGRGTAAPEEVVEVFFLLPHDQLAGLERAAGADGITVGRLLRRMVRDVLDRGHGGPGARARSCHVARTPGTPGDPR